LTGAAGQTVGSTVKLSIYDLSRKGVAVLVNETQPAGFYQIEFDASRLASGMYLYRLETDKYMETRKMILMR
jgi:hypothetical protein